MAVKERPILFSGDMVRAILDGRKSQTRRVINTGRFRQSDWSIEPCAEGWMVIRSSRDGIVFNTPSGHPAKSMQDRALSCPYGQPGDRLWVRETWGVIYGRCQSSLCSSNGCMFPQACPGDEKKAVFRADGVSYGSIDRWKPSIHMPRWASRITLEITGVRVERLQDISEEDAIAEGIAHQGWSPSYGDPDNYNDAPVIAPSDTFAELWDSLNAKRGYSFESNCWVWVIEFRRVQP